MTMTTTVDPIIASWEELSPCDLADWDNRIKAYNSKYLFHEACWLRFLERSQGAKIHGLKLLDAHGRVAGYFCGGEVRKGPLRLLGSPLQGWTTDYMGPIVNDFDAPSFLSVVERYCRTKGIDYVELCNPVLPAWAMNAADYQPDPGVSFIVTVDDESAMWDRLKSECRTAIRRGLKNGLSVERTTDPVFVGQYYDQLKKVFLRQGLAPTYGEERIQALWNCLLPEDRLLALRVWQGNEIIATGVFPFDERVVYGFGLASCPDKNGLRPNAHVQWGAMLFALERKIPLYNMCGGGSFKPKFGGVMVPFDRWFKPLSPMARIGRKAFHHYVKTRQRLLGLLMRVSLRHPSSSASD